MASEFLFEYHPHLCIMKPTTKQVDHYTPPKCDTGIAYLCTDRCKRDCLCAYTQADRYIYLDDRLNKVSIFILDFDGVYRSVGNQTLVKDLFTHPLTKGEVMREGASLASIVGDDIEDWGVIVFFHDLCASLALCLFLGQECPLYAFIAEGTEAALLLSGCILLDQQDSLHGGLRLLGTA